jgi:hypothetical protein
MTPFLTAAICLTAAIGVFLLRRELLRFGHAIVARLLEFKARLKEIDDNLRRR